MAERSLPDRILAFFEKAQEENQPPSVLAVALELAVEVEAHDRRLDELEQKHSTPIGLNEQFRVVPPSQGES